MARKVDMVDTVFGRLLVLEELPNKRVLAECECGATKEYLRGNLLSGYTQSCGCLRNERVREVCVTHGHKSSGTPTPTYSSWRAMKRRCDNPNSTQYKWYGGKGIRYCTEWTIFENFLRDMGERPEGLELSRIKDDDDYSPSNCGWENHTDNMRRRRA